MSHHACRNKKWQGKIEISKREKDASEMYGLIGCCLLVQSNKSENCMVNDQELDMENMGD